MMLQLLAYLGVSVIFVIVLIFFEMAVPMWRFQTRATDATRAYELLKNDLEKTFSLKGGASFKVKCGKYKLQFSNNVELLDELEKVIEDALVFYDKLGWIKETSDVYVSEKEMLLKIGAEVRMIRWRHS